jgi:integrase
MRILNRAQLIGLLRAIDGSEVEVPVLLAVWLGLRKSEICGLKWDCVNEKESVITIKNALVADENNEYVLKATKTYSSTRKFGVHKFIMDKIIQLPKNGEFVIDMNNNVLYKKFKKELIKNKLPDIRFHDLRHLNASVMLMLKIPNKYAMERGGWATDYTMENVYQHTFSDERIAVDRTVDDYFLDLLSSEK